MKKILILAVLVTMSLTTALAQDAEKKSAYGSFCRIKLRSRYSIAQIAG